MDDDQGDAIQWYLGLDHEFRQGQFKEGNGKLCCFDIAEIAQGWSQLQIWRLALSGLYDLPV